VDVFPLTLRAVATESLDNQVATQAIDRLSCAPDEVVIDYARLPVEATRDGEHGVSVLVFAVPRVLAERLLGTLDRAGFEVERLMTPACALAAAVARPDSAERHVVVFPTQEAASISVVENGHVLLERILPWSVRALVGHMHSELDLEEDQCRKLLLQEAVPGDSESGRASAPAGEPGTRGSLESALREILGPFFQDLAREVAGCVGYADSFLRRARIAGIVLTGPMAGNALLREFVAKASELPFVELEGRGGLPRRGECAPDYACTPAASCALWPQEVAS
jgi:Tfp pilus assembly PilM family ATPase